MFKIQCSRAVGPRLAENGISAEPKLLSLSSLPWKKACIDPNRFFNYLAVFASSIAGPLTWSFCSHHKSFITQYFFWVKKWALFTKGKKKNIMRLKNGDVSPQPFLRPVLHATLMLIIPSLRIIQARGCKQRFKSYVLYSIYMQYYSTVVQGSPSECVRREISGVWNGTRK